MSSFQTLVPRSISVQVLKCTPMFCLLAQQTGNESAFEPLVFVQSSLQLISCRNDTSLSYFAQTNATVHPFLCCYEWLPYSTFPKGASTGKHRMHPPPSAVHFFPLCPFQSIVVLQDEGTCKKLKEGGGRGGTSNITHTYDSWFARENTEYNSWGTETSTTKVRAKAAMAGNKNRNKNKELLFFFFLIISFRCHRAKKKHSRAMV